MAFGAKQQPAFQVSAARLAAVSGGGAATAAAMPASASAGESAPRRRVSVEPDVSRIRKNMIDETPEERKKRLAAKTVNFGATIIARIVIFAGVGLYAWKTYQFSGEIHRGVALGLFAMTADFGRVCLKAMTPGSK